MRRIALTVVAVTLLVGLALSPTGAGVWAEIVRRVHIPLVQRGIPPAEPSPCGGDGATLISNRSVYQTPAMAEPLTRVPFRDPVFGTCLTRVTDRNADLAAGDPSAGLKNEYSRVLAFNADGSRLVVRGIAATWYVYDADALQPLAQLPMEGPVDPRWDGANPDLLYYFDAGRLMGCDVSTLGTWVVHDFAPDLPGVVLSAVWTRYEGSPSVDGRYWGLVAQNTDWQPVALLVYDRSSDQVVARRDVSGNPEIDSVTMSLLGTYFLASYGYCEPGQMGSDSQPCGLMVWDRSLQGGRGLLRLVGHCDVALDVLGQEVLVYQDIDTDSLSMLNLTTGAVTPLWPIDYSHTALGFHFSGRAFRRPGWAVVSTYNGGTPADYTWMDDQVFAIELKANGRVARLAHTHSLYDETVEQDYWAEPHATANQDLTRILFTTNWGRTGTEQVETFVIDLPSDWPQRLR